METEYDEVDHLKLDKKDFPRETYLLRRFSMLTLELLGKKLLNQDITHTILKLYILIKNT